MALSKDRLKAGIIAIINDLAINETDPLKARDEFADKLSTLVVDEIKQIKITYTNGLQSGTGNVIGLFNYTIT